MSQKINRHYNDGFTAPKNVTNYPNPEDVPAELAHEIIQEHVVILTCPDPACRHDDYYYISGDGITSIDCNADECDTTMRIW
ncbi:hypothetical protein ACLI4Q_16255 [Natrialbaceae archaeon A-CW1-1]